jgi:hypothetical protein
MSFSVIFWIPAISLKTFVIYKNMFLQCIIILDLKRIEMYDQHDMHS